MTSLPIIRKPFSLGLVLGAALCLSVAASCLAASAPTPGPALAAAPPQAEAPPQDMEGMNTVVLRTIDKLSARTHTFDIPVDKTVKFGNSLFIKARACKKSSPLSTPEAAAFLQVWERKPAETKSHWVFSGWMFSSSPSLSRLDHPVYDVWVIECKNASTSAKEEFSSETAPAHAPDGAAVPAAAGVRSDATADKMPEVKTPEDKTGVDKSAAGDKAAAPPAKADEAAEDKDEKAGGDKAGEDKSGEDKAGDKPSKDDDSGDDEDAMGEGDDASGAASQAIPPTLGGKAPKPAPATPGPGPAPAAPVTTPAPAAPAAPAH
jgi:hypothetical protein